MARAGDKVRSWFGDEDAERRREMDSRYDKRYYNQQQHHRDADYGNWRSGQIAALDRDYDEYRHENRGKFESEFSSWRSNRQTQRQSLDKVQEHAGSSGPTAAMSAPWTRYAATASS
ncbi:SWFGD domain-containing protein [Sphingomonas sp. MMS24-JH45]